MAGDGQWRLELTGLGLLGVEGGKERALNKPQKVSAISKELLETNHVGGRGAVGERASAWFPSVEDQKAFGQRTFKYLERQVKPVQWVPRGIKTTG